MEIIAKLIVLLFGVFIILVGLLMLFNPKKARQILRKAGSTPLINYTEITIRIIPAVALILSSPISKFPFYLKLLGWFMLITSLILYLVPRRLHYTYSQKSADILKPICFQFIAPISLLFGSLIIYSVL
tara:strand:- start:59339 stop:59725 length:387 start_codon:yes stop_codon:yes gene_type:complete